MNTNPGEGINVWELTYVGDNGFRDSSVKTICADNALDAIEKSKYQNWNKGVEFVGKVKLVGLNNN